MKQLINMIYYTINIFYLKIFYIYLTFFVLFFILFILFIYFNFSNVQIFQNPEPFCLLT